MKSISVLINPRSGSVPVDAADRMRALLADLGETCELRMLDGDDIVSPIKAALDEKPDVLVVWSGDGTVACALQNAGAEGVPVLPLPGGTMNMFHKQIHGGPCEWNECLRRGLTEGKMIDVPAGTAGDHRFYVAAMAGNLTDLTGPREHLREGHFLQALQELSGSDLLDLRTTMTFETGGPSLDASSGFATAASIFVGTHEESAFEFAYIDPDNPLELMASGLGALFSDWRDASGVTTLRAVDVVLNHERGKELRVTLDGEPTRLKSGTRFTRIEKAGRAISAQI